MKANEFVKKYGWALVKRDIAALNAGFIKRDDFFENYGFDIIDDLKRLVEAHDLIESFGSLEDAKEYEDLVGGGLFTEAIKLMESCQ